MTFNAAFPSSPLSRSALQSDPEARMRGGIDRSFLSSPCSEGSDEPSNWTRTQTPVNRRASEGISKAPLHPLLFSPSHGSNNYSSSPRPSLYSTSPLQSPPTRSPDSILSRSLATSPHSNLRLSPVFRSTPSSTNRRRFSEQSFGSGSALHHSPGPSFGSFVGSYEESLLSGRMSSLPSKPLMFDAELGVLGLGKCKASLKCPPHVNFTFPAHFYSLENVSDKEGSLSPGTPYVGTIDVEGHYIDMLLGNNGAENLGIPRDPSGLGSPSAQVPFINAPSTQDVPSFPGYRIPPKGQIQLIIKNPNLTAVKFFLIPYDFTDMPAGTKTFIRQKSSVASPGLGGVESNIAMPPCTSPPTSFQRSPGRISGSGRDTLRYAVHLNFCALPSNRVSKGRHSEPGFTAGGLDRLTHRRKSEETEGKTKKRSPNIYLHKHIRVVFTARVPDHSEKLRVVTETPGGSEGNRQHIYSTYLGPSEEWKEAKKMSRRFRSTSRDADMLIEEDGDRVEGIAVEGQDIPLREAAFHDGIINSDPNGEKWFAEGGADEEEAQAHGVDIPLTSRSPWREPDEEPLLHHTQETSGTSAPVTSFPSAAFNDGNSRSATTLVTPVQRTISPDAESTVDDRALLEQWHASLTLRSHSIRPPSPNTPTTRSRPTSPPFAKRPISPTNNFFSLMNRSGSSIGSASNGSSSGIAAGVTSQRRLSSANRLALRPVVSKKSGDLTAIPHGPTPARPVQASLDLDHASAFVESSAPLALSSSGKVKKPDLLRLSSSKSLDSASSSGRDSPPSPSS